MRVTKIASIRKIGVSLLALLVTVPLICAQRQQQSQREETAPKNEPSRAPAPRQEPAPRSEPARGAPVQRSPVVVDRTNHGTIRHLDTHVVQRPVEAPHVVEVPHGVDQHQSNQHQVDQHQSNQRQNDLHQYDQHQHVIVHRDVDVDIDRSRFWHGFVFGERHHDLRAGYIQIFVSGTPYYYDDGIYYQQQGQDYQEVYPPVGADVQELPDGAIEIDAGNLAYYYAGGAFYVQQDGGFVIAPTPMGVTIPELPPGAVEVIVNGAVAYQFNGIYYQPVFVDGVTQYMTFTP
jgi:uncharacterized protein DUF6515